VTNRTFSAASCQRTHHRHDVSDADGRGCLLTPVGDPIALAAAVVRMLQGRAFAMRFRLSAHADAASRFAMSGMVTAYEQLYGELLANG
jgi:hypothetical protein